METSSLIGRLSPTHLTSIETFTVPPDIQDNSRYDLNGKSDKLNGVSDGKFKTKSKLDNGNVDKTGNGKMTGEDLRNYSYEGNNSSPGSLSSCKFISYYNVNIFHFFSILINQILIFSISHVLIS